jgi:hypothetical protein
MDRIKSLIPLHARWAIGKVSLDLPALVRLQVVEEIADEEPGHPLAITRRPTTRLLDHVFPVLGDFNHLFFHSGVGCIRRA